MSDNPKKPSPEGALRQVIQDLLMEAALLDKAGLELIQTAVRKLILSDSDAIAELIRGIELDQDEVQEAVVAQAVDDIDLTSLAGHFDTDDIAGEIDLDSLASSIDMDDLSQHVRDNLDYDALAVSIGTDLNLDDVGDNLVEKLKEDDNFQQQVKELIDTEISRVTRHYMAHCREVAGEMERDYATGDPAAKMAAHMIGRFLTKVEASMMETSI